MAKKPFRKLEIIADANRDQKINAGAKRRGVFRFTRNLQPRNSQPVIPATPSTTPPSPPSRTAIPMPSESAHRDLTATLRAQSAQTHRARNQRQLAMGILKVVGGVAGIYFFLHLLGGLRMSRTPAFPFFLVVGIAMAILRRRLFR